MKRSFYLHTVLTFIFLVIPFKKIVSQTNPTPQSLPYSQSFGTLLSTSTTFPIGWQGWNLSTVGSSTAFRTVVPVTDLTLQASSTAATSTEGIHNYNGKIGFLATATADPALCLAISTTGYFSVSVSFDVLTIRNPFVAVTNTRINQVDLQYRVGTTGIFTTVTAVANGLYQNSTVNQTTAVTTPQNQLSKLFTLPSSCNNQPIVQLRFVQRDFSGVGASRPGFAVDNISICSTLVTPTIAITGPAAFCSGGSAIYTSTITNGGLTPSYQWKKNGVNAGTGSSITLSGLIVGDQIICVLTSNATCASSLTATSNTIGISSINSSPVISTNSITNVSCPGIRDGAIDISISGGTAPYTVAWDTANISNGPTFAVTVGPKAVTHPLFGQGNASTFVIDGVGGKELFLTKGITYSFNVLAPAHPFHISTDLAGGNITNIVSSGQTGAPTQSGTVNFTPNNSHPSLLYYPCQFHTFMGYKVNITNGVLSEDVSNLRAGTYSAIVTDANGCTATAQFQISELPSPITLGANITNSTCGLLNGSIDLLISGGVGPYSVIWDTLNRSTGPNFGVTVGTKTISNPYFGLGSLSDFFIDGIETPQLNLVKGINYSFNVFGPGHPFHISSDLVGGTSTSIFSSGQSNSPNDNGTVSFTPPISAPSLLYYVCANHQYMGYNVNISNGYSIEDPTALLQGVYSVIVTDALGCTSLGSYTVMDDGSPVGVSLISQTGATCFGQPDGAIDVDPSGGIAPYSMVGQGPIFSVIPELKNQSHPQFGLGARPDGFTINGVQGMELTLVRGITYAFAVMAPTHAFFISTSDAGGLLNLGSEVTDGVVNSMISSGTLFFTPNAGHPSLLYYQCGVHDYMGWKINIVDQGFDGDQSALMAGDYLLSAVDATGCASSTPVTFTINQPSPNAFYYDADVDGYGTTNITAQGCNPPAGFVTLSGDCDDADPSINPGAIEVCDLVDNNCNGLIDDSDPTLSATRWYADLDADGFGDANDVGVVTCTQPPNTSSNNTDCDDNNSQINPGAVEICNLIDDDCDGLIDEGANCFCELTLNLFLQGYYVGTSTMLPVADPLNNPMVCDSLIVELASEFSPFGIEYTTTGVIDVSGNGVFSFPLSAKGNSYYIVVHHRSSLETWSSLPVLISNICTYNFTSSASQAFGDNEIQLESGVFGIWSGDVNQDDFIDDTDFLTIENGSNVFGIGYIPEDITGDWIIESSDYSMIENNTGSIITLLRP